MRPNDARLALVAAAILLGSLLGCRSEQPTPVRFTANVVERDLTWPSAVDLQGPGSPVQRDGCFPTAVGPYCVEGDALVPLSGVLNLVDSASRNTAGDWLIGNRPFVFFSRDGGSHRCASLPGFVYRLWLGSDEPGVVVATAHGSNWLSRDECRTWQRLGIDDLLGAVEASGGVMTAVALVYDPVPAPLRFVGYRYDLTTGESAAVALEGPNARAAVDDEGFLGLGAGLTRYDRLGVQQGERTFTEFEVLAACRNGPVLVASEVYRDGDFGTFYCRLSAYGPDGTFWWRQEGEPGNCRAFEKGAACADKTRLFVNVAQVVLEVTREGLKPLSAPEVASMRVSSVVDGEGVRLIMGDGEGTATLAEWAPQTGWSWLGLGTIRTRNEIDRFSFGPMKLSMYFGGRNGCSGFKIADIETGREITTVAQRCIDIAPPQIPQFRQLNMPAPALLFNSVGDCQVLTLDPEQKATAYPCNPLGTFIHASVMADPVTAGRWIVTEDAQFPRESLLVEDFGARVVGLGRSDRFVFDENGEPLSVGEATAVYSVGAPERLGYLMVGVEEGPGRETGFTRFIPFHGEERVWPHSELMAGSADGFLLRTRGGLKKLMFEPKVQ